VHPIVIDNQSKDIGMNYGLENSANWGWDWFGSLGEAVAAMKSRPALYGTNSAPWELSVSEINERGL